CGAGDQRDLPCEIVHYFLLIRPGRFGVAGCHHGNAFAAVVMFRKTPEVTRVTRRKSAARRRFHTVGLPGRCAEHGRRLRPGPTAGSCVTVRQLKGPPARRPTRLLTRCAFDLQRLGRRYSFTQTAGASFSICSAGTSAVPWPARWSGVAFDYAGWTGIVGYVGVFLALDRKST